MPASTIDILLNEPIGRINPNIYGHFMEHLGGCIEGGCWVGDDAQIAHTGGVRNDVVEALRNVGAPAIRWPGGCFADDYHWQDGVGLRASRPRRINIHWGSVIETNEFGTHEFMAFCRAVGAEPYFCGNLGSGSVREMRDWVEYCNFPGDSEWARQRRANGQEAPFDVCYWGVGNENWGCGGNFSPEDYGSEYRRYATYLRNWGKDPLFLIACGPNENDLDWTRRFFTKLKKDYWGGPSLHGYAAHYYTWNHGEYGTATEYDEAQWYGLLAKSLRMEPLVVQQRALMDAFDPERKIGLIVDEWGTWHPAAPDHNPAFLWQQNTMRDALVAALTLDIFNRHADKVVMANIAQTVNVLQALLLTDGDKMLKTPTYHVYDLYKDHQGGQSLRVLVDTPVVDADIKDKTGVVKAKLPVVSGSASRKGSVLTLTLVNTSATENAEVTLRLFGADLPSVTNAVSLAHPDIHAHNTHDAPEEVMLTAAGDLFNGSSPVVSLSPASVTRLTLNL
jgi:alpha-N-arabinofuranosidase